MVAVIPSNHSDPLHVVNYAISKFKKGYSDRYGKIYKAHDFDEIYVVIDTDCHENLSEALSLIEKFNNEPGRTKIQKIISCPCFELWFLLHFIDLYPKEITQKEVLDLLRKEIPNYDKSYDIYPQIRENLEVAEKRAKRMKDNIKFENDCYTDVYKLISELKEYSEAKE